MQLAGEFATLSDDVAVMRRHLLNVLSLAAFVGVIALLCAFKVYDLDVWWHLKAGELMVRTRAWIHTDPFAYTRAGQPYLATYEWLGQIILYLIHAAGGATALILLRTLLVALTFFLLARINLPSLWLALPVGLLAAESARTGFTDRPLMFTYVLFAAFILIATRMLDADDRESRDPTAPGSSADLRRWIGALLVLEVLWVNLHGAAALLGVLVFGALVLQRLWDALTAGRWRTPAEARDLRWLGAGLAGLLLAQFVSPNGVSSLTYLYFLFTDRTQSLITEWQPREWGPYLHDFAGWWITALFAIAATRRRPIFSTAVVLGFGVLSRLAFRHEPLFVMAALGVIIYQWRWNRPASHVADWLRFRAWRAAATLVVVYTLLGFAAYRAWLAFGQQELIYGYGAREMAAGAAAFLEREDVQGPMFNMYDIGADLLYHDRKVFVDGRNVDYGFPFLKRVFDAAGDRKVWDALDEEYRFTHAVLWYRPFVNQSSLPFIVHLEHDPRWALVYLDDRAAVYLKAVPENLSIIERCRYRLVTPRDLYTSDVLQRTPRAQLSDVVGELNRLAASDPESIQARLVLAQIYIGVYRFDDAQALLRSTMATEPHAYRPHEVLAALYARQEKWAEAGRELETAVALYGVTPPTLDYRTLADVFEKAGDTGKADRYRKLIK
jgi:hypothetical protein